MAKKKVLYAATFPDGTRLTRGTARTYSHAWRVVSDEGCLDYGFSGTRHLAERTAAPIVNRWTKVPRPRTNIRYEIATAAIVPEGFERQVKAREDAFRVKRTYQSDDRSYWETGKHRKHLRFATRGEAEAHCRELLQGRTAVTFTVHED